MNHDSISNHDHDTIPDSDIIKGELRQSLKRKAVKQPNGRPSKLVCDETENVDEEIFFDTDYFNFTKAMYRAVRKGRPPLPRCLEDVNEVLKMAQEEPSFKGSVLVQYVSKDIVMFASEHSFKLMSSKDCTLLADGTFKFCPKFYKQLYTLHQYVAGVYTPTAFFLLKDKRFHTYRNMLNIIKMKLNVSNLDFDVQTFIVDFERSMLKAIADVLPGCKIRGCNFHLAQAWMKKIQRLGMSTLYQNKRSVTGKWLRHLFGFRMMKWELVPQAFEDYAKLAPPGLAKFLDYLRRTWMTEQSKFPPKLWAGAAQSNVPNTTNACESFHLHFGKLFNSPHPNIYVFLENLHDWAKLARWKARRSKPVIVKKPASIILDAFLFEVKHISVSTFLSRMATRLDPPRLLRSTRRRRAQAAKKPMWAPRERNRS